MSDDGTVVIRSRMVRPAGGWCETRAFEVAAGNVTVLLRMRFCCRTVRPIFCPGFVCNAVRVGPDTKTIVGLLNNLFVII